jgi:hypothetical protein
MSVFDQAGVYARNPQGGVEHVQDLLDAGFRWYAFNVGDHTVPEWKTVIDRCRALGMPVFPWQYVRSDDDVWALCRVARRRFGGRVIVNAEKPLDEGRVTAVTIRDATEGMDAAVSVEPLPYGNVDWTVLSERVIQLQLFPQENTTSQDPRACRLAYLAAGCKRADFMLGMHELTPASFPARQYGYSVYTVDDMGPDCAAWGPQEISPLDEIAFPKVTPGYGPSSPSGKPPSQPSRMWKALKRALHRAGFGDFPTPDEEYDSELATAMAGFQRAVGIVPTGDFGEASYQALRGYLAFKAPGSPAMDARACRWAREAMAAGDPQ